MPCGHTHTSASFCHMSTASPPANQEDVGTLSPPEENLTNVCWDTNASLVSVLPAKTIMCVCDTSYLNVVYSEGPTGFAVSFDLWVNNLKAQMCLSRKNSRQETAIHSSQIKPLLSDLLVWGSKHSTERRQDEPSRPPTAYSLRTTEDGVIPYGHTQAPQHIAHISCHHKSMFNLVMHRQMV